MIQGEETHREKEIKIIKKLINSIEMSAIEETQIDELKQIKDSLQRIYIENLKNTEKKETISLIQKTLPPMDDVKTNDLDCLLKFCTPFKSIRKKDSIRFIDYFLISERYFSVERLPTNIYNYKGTYDVNTLTMYKRVSKNVEATYLIPTNDCRNLLGEYPLDVRITIFPDDEC